MDQQVHHINAYIRDIFYIQVIALAILKLELSISPPKLNEGNAVSSSLIYFLVDQDIRSSLVS